MHIEQLPAQGPVVMKKLAQPYQRDGFAIINCVGDVWGNRIYSSAEEAAAHLDQFWGKRDWRADCKYYVAPATCIVIVTGKERIKL